MSTSLHTLYQRMRLQTYTRIKRQKEAYEQRMRLISGKPDKRSTCRFNAHSSFLLCAVNPSGPCETCTEYEPKREEDR